METTGAVAKAAADDDEKVTATEKKASDTPSSPNLDQEPEISDAELENEAEESNAIEASSKNSERMKADQTSVSDEKVTTQPNELSQTSDSKTAINAFNDQKGSVSVPDESAKELKMDVDGIETQEIEGSVEVDDNNKQSEEAQVSSDTNAGAENKTVEVQLDKSENNSQCGEESMDVTEEEKGGEEKETQVQDEAGANQIDQEQVKAVVCNSEEVESKDLHGAESDKVEYMKSEKIETKTKTDSRDEIKPTNEAAVDDASASGPLEPMENVEEAAESAVDNEEPPIAKQNTQEQNADANLIADHETESKVVVTRQASDSNTQLVNNSKLTEGSVVEEQPRSLPEAEASEEAKKEDESSAAVQDLTASHVYTEPMDTNEVPISNELSADINLNAKTNELTNGSTGKLEPDDQSTTLAAEVVTTVMCTASTTVEQSNGVQVTETITTTTTITSTKTVTSVIDSAHSQEAEPTKLTNRTYHAEQNTSTMLVDQSNGRVTQTSDTYRVSRRFRRSEKRGLVRQTSSNSEESTSSIAKVWKLVKSPADSSKRKLTALKVGAK